MPVDISTAELRTMLRTHTSRKRDGTKRARGEEALRTIMSATTTHYRRVHGEDSASLGDLRWITAASFDDQSASPTTQPVKEGGAHASARGAAARAMMASGQRRLADNLRSVLLSAAAATSASPDVDGDEKKALLAAWDVEYRKLTAITEKLERDEHRRILSGQLSERQREHWIDQPELKALIAPLVSEAIAVFGGADAAALANEPARFKKMQTSVQIAMHLLVPPGRNDYPGLRFVEGVADDASLRATGSPNYVLVADDGGMELVIGAYKSDGHTAADSYDPAQGDFVLGLDTELRVPLVPDATMTKFGFAPELLHMLLSLYRRASRTIFGPDRNPHEYLFFNFADTGVVTPIQADALGKRVGRRMKAITGSQAPRTQLFRVIFCTWFNEQSPTDADREFMAKNMMHSVDRQLCNYNKRVTRSKLPAPKRQKALEESGEL